jgi:hypothetical protein
MEQPSLRFRELAAKTMVCHTITYVLMGLLAGVDRNALDLRRGLRRGHDLHARPGAGANPGLAGGSTASTAALLCHWVDHPGQKWISQILKTVFFVVIALPVLLAGH